MERQRQQRPVHRDKDRRERKKEDQVGGATGNHTPAY
jgi:hypothetical protein